MGTTSLERTVVHVSVERELEVMKTVTDEFERLTPLVQRRVLRWLQDRYGYGEEF